MSVYAKWGFSTNPFTTKPVESSSLGVRIFAGREKELAALRRRLLSPPKMATVEGPNGVGKTSLVNVAAYQLFAEQLEQANDELLVPCQKGFQLAEDTEPATFKNDVLLAVAQTLIARREDIVSSGLQSGRNAPLGRWLNSPEVKSWGATIANFGAQGARAMNESAGFQQSGMSEAIVAWLRQTFPSTGSGGVLCVIDNLELIRSSAGARRLLEQLRDEVFQLEGLRWVFSGAMGIVLSVAGSPRLEGYLHQPVEVGELTQDAVRAVIPKRIEAFEVSPGMGVLPIAPDDFTLVYESIGKNLRHTLSRADDFCMFVADQGVSPAQARDKSAFLEWLAKDAKVTHDAVLSDLTPRPWDVFQRALQLGGTFSPSAYEEFGANSQMALRPHVAELERVGLVASVQDETDGRRRTVSVTAKGWLVNYHLTMTTRPPAK
jgi:Winged helix DNA-binding domain